MSLRSAPCAQRARSAREARARFRAAPAVAAGTLDGKCQGLAEFRSKPLRKGPHARVGKEDFLSDGDLAVREQSLFIGSLIHPKPVGCASPGRIFTVDSCGIKDMTRQQHVEVIARFA